MSNEAQKGSWDEDFKPKDKTETGDKKANWMKFEKPGNYTVRLVGKHVKFLRHWQPFTGRVITHESYKGQDPAWEAKFYPRKTFAINVIDRADGKLKILEKGAGIFKSFAEYKSVNDIDPSGKSAPDFVIKVEWPDGNSRSAKYTVTPKAAQAPLTAEEIEMCKTEFANLPAIYASTPLEKIQEMWNQLSDDQKIPPVRDEDDKKASAKPSTKTATAPAAKTVVAVEPPPVVPESDEGLFEKEDSPF